MLFTGERNYGCRFLEVTLFGLRTLILENEKIRIMVLLDKGTEIIEFNHKESDTDFIWRSPQGLSCLKSTQAARKDEQYLTDGYTGGWFEAFPNVGDACTYKGANIPFYGEVCYLPWEYEVVRDDPEQVSLRCFVRTVKSPYRMEKLFTVKSGMPSLYIEEKITNLGKEELGFQWGHHPNFGAPFLDGSCVIDLPGGSVAVPYELETSRFSAGISGIWPYVADRTGSTTDLRIMPARNTGTMDLLFLSSLKGGWAAVRNTEKNIGIGLSWDRSMFDHLLVWAVANGDRGYPRYGDTYVLCILPKSCDQHGLISGDVKMLGAGESTSAWLTATAFTGPEALRGIDREGRVTR